jgi:hypothetical protein
MSDGRGQQPGYRQGYPQPGYGPQGQPGAARSPVPPQDPPDFLGLAWGQIAKVIKGIDQAAGADGVGEQNDKVRAARLEVADRLIAMADIQYNLPDDEDDEEDL